MTKLEIFRKLRNKTRIQEITKCWLWEGARNSGGKGSTRLESGSTSYLVHRLSAHIFLKYDLNDKESQINHLCSNPNCWHPRHIYIGNQQENMQDRYRLQQPITHCKRGHEFTEENTYHWKNQRRCRECDKLRHIK